MPTKGLRLLWGPVYSQFEAYNKRQHCSATSNRVSSDPDNGKASPATGCPLTRCTHARTCMHACTRPLQDHNHDLDSRVPNPNIS